MNRSDTFAVSEEVVARRLGEEIVLLDLSSGVYFGLDAVGARVWELLSEKPRSLAQLAEHVEAEFSAPRATIEEDLRDLARVLRERDLIIIRPA